MILAFAIWYSLAPQRCSIAARYRSGRATLLLGLDGVTWLARGLQVGLGVGLLAGAAVAEDGGHVDTVINLGRRARAAGVAQLTPIAVAV